MKQYFTVKDGTLSDGAKQWLRSELKRHEGKDIAFSIERKRKPRSLGANAYYWGVVIPMVHAMLVDFGNDCDQEETHAFLKEVVGKLTGSINCNGKRMAIVKSSASLSSAEFEQYLERVRRWAAGFGTVIPSPNEHLNPPIEAYA